MSGTHIEVTYRKGKPFAAYLYLPRRPHDTSAHTEKVGDVLVVDFAPDGRPIGIEILAPGHVSARRINAVLGRFAIAPLPASELAPVTAAG